MDAGNPVYVNRNYSILGRTYVPINSSPAQPNYPIEAYYDNYQYPQIQNQFEQDFSQYPQQEEPLQPLNQPYYQPEASNYFQNQQPSYQFIQQDPPQHWNQQQKQQQKLQQPQPQQQITPVQSNRHAKTGHTPSQQHNFQSMPYKSKALPQEQVGPHYTDYNTFNLNYDFNPNTIIEVVSECAENVGFDYYHSKVKKSLYKEKYQRDIELDKPQEGDNVSRDVKTDFQKQPAQVLSQLSDTLQHKLRTSWIEWVPCSMSVDAINTSLSVQNSIDPNSNEQPFSIHLDSLHEIIKNQPFIADKGYEMAIRMGYNPTKGLGREEDGEMLPIDVLFTRSKTGLGSVSKKKRGTMTEHCKVCKLDFPMNDFKTHLHSKKHQKNLLKTADVEITVCEVCKINIPTKDYYEHTFSKKHKKKENVNANYKLHFCEACQVSFPVSNYDTHLISKIHQKYSAPNEVKKRALRAENNNQNNNNQNNNNQNNTNDNEHPPKKRLKLENYQEIAGNFTQPSINNNINLTNNLINQPASAENNNNLIPTPNNDNKNNNNNAVSQNTLAPQIIDNNNNLNIPPTPLAIDDNIVFIQCPHCNIEVKEIEWKIHVLTRKHKRAAEGSA